MSEKTTDLQVTSKDYAKQLKDFEKNVKDFEKKQNKLVKDHPFVEIIDHKTYEEAKVNRTALLKGRTGLQGQEKAIKSVVNNIKSFTTEKIKGLIDITLPSEQKQQEEVKRYENEREEKRLKKEREAEEARQKAISEIDVIFEEVEAEIDSINFNNIEEVEKGISIIAETEVSDDLDIYFSTKVKSTQNKFVSKVDQLKIEKELHEGRQKNSLLELVNKWSIAILDAQAHNISELNTKFDEQIPSLESNDYEPFQELFNHNMKALRSQLVDKTNSLKEEVKKNKQKAKEEAEAEAERLSKAAIRDTINKKYSEAKQGIEKLPLYGYKETTQAVEEKIMLLQAEANNIEYSAEINEKVEALQNSLKLRIIDIKDEIRRQEEEEAKEAKRKKEESAKRIEAQEKAAAESKKTEQEKIEFEKATQVDYVDLIELVKYLNFEKSQIPEFETEEGKKAFKKIRQILTESKDDMNIIINSIMKR